MFGHLMMERMRRDAIMHEALMRMMQGAPDAEEDPLLEPIQRIVDVQREENASVPDLHRISPGTDEGRRMKNEAEELKDRGNAAFKNKHYAQALEFYTLALVLASQIRYNEEQVAILLSNRSGVFCAMKEFTAALEDAKKCLAARPNWFKGGLRVMRAYIGLNKYQEAFVIGIGVSSSFNFPEKDVIEMFVEAMILLPQVEDYTKMKNLIIKDQGWTAILEALTKKKAWRAISVLFQGKGGAPPILKTYKPTDLDLSGLLESCSVDDWRSWGQRLAVKLLQSGTKTVNLDAAKRQAAHSAMRVAIRTGVYDLLKHLFLHYIPTGDRDRVDDAGDTLLHLACRERYPSKVTAVKLLLEHNLSPLCKNKQQKKPLDLLPDDDPDRGEIFKVMTDKGYGVDALVSESKFLKEETPEHTATAALQATASPPATEPCVETQGWTKEDVAKWMQRNRLTEILKSLGALDGRQLAELRTVQETAPATFYQLLHHTLGLSLVQLLTLASAIRHLP